jgi:hypothetical protein
MSQRRFDEKDPGEKWPLTFDFTVDLPTGVTLSGTPEVAFATALGTDATPNNLANGSAALDQTSKKVVVPVQGGVDGCDYKISVKVGTTDPLLVLELDGVLPVRA